MSENELPPYGGYGVADASPSDQLIGDPNAVHVLAFAFGASISRVEGLGRLKGGKSFRFRKWSKAKTAYKREFIEMVPEMLEEKELFLAIGTAKEKHISAIGSAAWTKAFGVPPKIDHNKKGVARWQMGGYTVDGRTVAPFYMNARQAPVLGWYAQAFAELGPILEPVIGRRIVFSIVFDKLPLDTADHDKAILFTTMTQRLSNQSFLIAGVPIVSDQHPRDLFVDNAAGAYRECLENPKSELAKVLNANPSPRIIRHRISRVRRTTS